ncbi:MULTISPECIES: hypothetical protein [unclassified Corynebacterium]|uniref:hypothetical protein n=1 Tax=unclassified Corynebacterium TaxID=2624378 RepID=UPI0029CA4DFD|nr:MULTISPECIES: hypothetical protein [unclassified Corynebacterium]WPF66568.1 hypothetical protein OLX12_02225 [Corynebacterium sp. 22KM0430]WPF69057.1 hypothetical protein OLW90_02220 [Corynebacterium sp. 21KM1197]
MFALIDKLSDYVYGLFLTALGAALGAGVMVRAMNPLEPYAVPASWRWAAAVSIGAVLVVLAERLTPLRGISRERWVWRYRLARRLPGIDRAVMVQGAASAVVGAFLGAVTGYSFLAVIGASAGFMVTRLVVGWARGRGSDLPGLLEAGRTRSLVENLAGLQDTELVSDLMVMNWLRGRSRAGREKDRRAGAEPVALGAPRRRALGLLGVLGILGARRLWRRGYVLSFAGVVVAWQVALAQAYGAWGRLITVVAWGIVCAAVYRATNFSRVTRALVTPWGYMLACVGLGIAVYAAWAESAAEVAAVAVIWGYMGWKRGKPAAEYRMSYFDSGMGVSFSPEIMRYYLRGLWPVAVAALLIGKGYI